MSNNRFENKIALVVGAGAGMGAAAARQLAGEGAKVIALDIFEDRLERLTNETKGLNFSGGIETYLGDICDPKTVNGVVEHIKNKYATLDILAYAAGILDFLAPPEQVDDELWDRVMDVNVKSVWRVVKTAAPLMKNHEDAASVTIVTSVGGRVGSSSGAAYIASKHAAEGLMRNLAFSYKNEKIRVNAVAPGSFATEIVDTAKRLFPERRYEHNFCPEGIELFYKKGIGILNPRSNVGDPKDIAEAICFLSSREAKFISGASLVVDGGWLSA